MRLTVYQINSTVSLQMAKKEPSPEYKMVKGICTMIGRDLDTTEIHRLARLLNICPVLVCGAYQDARFWRNLFNGSPEQLIEETQEVTQNA